jgi:uncharacterized protein YjbI with pentapeptide repeats
MNPRNVPSRLDGSSRREEALTSSEFGWSLLGGLLPKSIAARLKLQPPNSKIQISSNRQRSVCGALRFLWFSGLKFFWSLEFGVWSFPRAGSPGLRFATAATSLLLLTTCVTFGAASRNVTLQLTATNNGAIISWQAKSAVPAPGRQLVPEFQLESSANLTNWTPRGARITGALNNQILNVVDPTGGNAAFYRVKSVVEQPFGDFIGEDLRFGEFASANFFGAEFFNAQLDDAILTDADLRGTDLRFAALSGAKLDGADLFAADLLLSFLDFTSIEHADVSFANLEGADLFGSSFLGSDLRSSIFVGADLRFVTFHESQIDAHTRLPDKSLKIWQLVNHQATNIVFTNLDLSFADLRSADLRGLNFAGSDFSANDLGGADVRNANFTGANMRFVVWQQALMDSNTVIEARSRLTWELINQDAVGRDLHGTNLSNMLLSGVDLRQVNLTNANLSLAVLDNANLGSANLRSANFNSVSFIGAILTNAALNSANFSFTDLTDANLFGATTNGTIFNGATFSNTIMPDGSVR